ncbi:24899_t:CDS:2, partial [Racocetra persica]
MTDESSPGAKNRVLKLSVADFGGVLDTSKIIIDDTDFDDDTGTELGLVVNRQGQKDALLNLERLLEDHLPNKYQVKYPDEFDYEKGPDADFIDSISDLGDPPSTTNPYLHFSGHLLGLGVKKKSEFAILAGAGGGGYEQGDVTEIEKEPGFYKGFPLIDPNLKATPDPTDDNKFKVEKIDSDKPVRFIKENIDNFRAFATGYTGSNSDIFTKEKTIKDREGNDVQ